MPIPPLGVPADLQSAVKKCPNLFMFWGFVIPNIMKDIFESIICKKNSPPRWLMVS